MLLKLGVDISRLERPVRRALPIIDQAYGVHGKEAVITSTYEGTHTAGSLHYANLAVDLRHPGGGYVMAILRKLREDLKDHGFDIIEEGDHLHIEYDPKG